MSEKQQINMIDDEDDGYALNLCTILPAEVLLHIFDYLPAKQLQICRQVCLRWRDIIDHLVEGLTFWERTCKRDFPSLYRVAYDKFRGFPTWLDVYRSLSLWRHLPSAREEMDEFASPSQDSGEIRNIELLTCGLMVVHRRFSVTFYESDSLEPSLRRVPVSGNFVQYSEIDDVVVARDFDMHLHLERLTHDVFVTYNDVKYSIILNRNVYYVNLENEIFLCDLKDPALRSTFIKQCNEAVMCLSYNNDRLHILTVDGHINSIVDDKEVLACCFDDHKNLLHQIYKYNFLERLDWYIFFQWLCIFNQRNPDGPLRDILTVRPYGDMVFVGCQYGVLRVYYKPFINGEFDFYNAEPVKQYNFMERLDCPVLGRCPIMKVDVTETDVGHTVFVAMPKKVAVINFIHNSRKKEEINRVNVHNSFERVNIVKKDEIM